MDNTYAEPGTWVILISGYRDPENWGILVGRKARIIQSGNRMCVVKVDDEEIVWKIQNMILSSDIPLLTPEQRRYLRIRENG